jgi:ribosomal-protein-alanine N-acetyltransferase
VRKNKGDVGHTFPQPEKKDGTREVNQGIRPATGEDLDRIMEIERLSFPDQWQREQFRAALKDIFLVWADVQVRGFLIACPLAGEKRAVIMRIAVHPESRGQGITKALLGRALGELQRWGVREVEIDVKTAKPEVRQLYEKAGFRLAQVLSLDGAYEDDSFYIMTLELPETGDRPAPETTGEAE